MYKIKLEKDEYKYLCEASFIPEDIKEFLCTQIKDSKTLKMFFTAEQADEIREQCGDQLQHVGFDEEYELTLEGEILERLIDKLPL